MKKSLRVLIVEDSEDDTLLLLRELRRGGYQAEFQRVETSDSMKDALEKQNWDVVVCDYVLPRFSGLAALDVLRETALDLPFIIVSGNICEDVAINAMKAGAHDYIMKGNLKRLIPAVERELHEAEVRMERKQAREALEFSHSLLQIANRHTAMRPLLAEFMEEIKTFSGCAAVGIRLLDGEGNIPYEALTGFPEEFYRLESPLSLHTDACMCINVIKGNTDPQLPFYTKGGSFYMNGTSRFLATVSEEQKGETRNTCNRLGYESVALIPILVGEQIMGVFHLADPREDLVPLRKVEVLEKVAPQLGTAIQRIRAQEELKSQMAKLEALNEELRDFAFAAAHDLQEPLRKIITFGDLLQSRNEAFLAEPYHGFLERMIKSAQRMSDSLRSLLVYSRIGSRPNLLVPSDLIQVARDAVSDIELSVEETRAHVEIGELITIKVNPDQIRRLFRNLIGNAIKFSRKDERPLVKVYGKVENGTYRIFVEDNGIGFQEEYVDRIFRPFQRLHVQSEYEGIGMGLAICRKIAESHGGNITVRSTPGRGSTFIVTLPFEQSSD